MFSADTKDGTVIPSEATCMVLLRPVVWHSSEGGGDKGRDRIVCNDFRQSCY